MFDSQKIVDTLRSKGPSVPGQLTKEIGKDTMVIGAALSELAASKKVAISSVKIGGSPVYYLPEQKMRLQDLYKHLNGKDKTTFDLLKERKVIRDHNATPLLRVSLRNLKDFASPLEVNIQGKKELFWKWYLVPQEEAITEIKKLLNIPKPQPPKPKIVEKKREIKPTSSRPKEVKPSEKQKPKPVQKDLVTQTIQKPEDDSFYTSIENYFKQKKIEITHLETIRKNSEMNFTLKVPSAVGESVYYCKAKNKKRISDSDLATAVLEGQHKQLPVLYITTGEVTKKAQAKLGKEFKNIQIVQIEV